MAEGYNTSALTPDWISATLRVQDLQMSNTIVNNI